MGLDSAAGAAVQASVDTQPVLPEQGSPAASQRTDSYTVSPLTAPPHGDLLQGKKPGIPAEGRNPVGEILAESLRAGRETEYPYLAKQVLDTLGEILQMVKENPNQKLLWEPVDIQ